MKNLNLLEGPIGKVLFRLALPLMGISFVEMTYGFVDTLWLGRLSTEAVAAVGGISIFVWLAHAIMLISKTGMSVELSQALGKGDEEEAKKVVAAGFQANFLFCAIITALFFFGRDLLIGFYGLDETVGALAESYLKIMSLGLVFTFFNPMLSAIFVTNGNSVTPFKVSTLSLLFNMIMDPLLIFGIGFFPKMGVAGAAWATVLAQLMAFIIFLYLLVSKKSILTTAKFFSFYRKNFLDIIKLGVPACLQSMVHAIVGVILNRQIASFGSTYIAVYSIGAQIESISWMSAEGFAAAVSAFIGQNYGKKCYDRIHRGYLTGVKIIGTIGILASFLLFFGAEDLYRIFVPHDANTIYEGGRYLRIISLSQFLMTMEIVTSGAMNGLGLTRYPAIVAVVLNIMRIPMAFALMPFLGITGIWWAMSITSILKGIGIYGFYRGIGKRTEGFRIHMDRYVSRQEV
ncbi:MATE family efflux transporter [Peptoniphilus sp. KCTC 25270]|uniref:MATE family efflux transporter n=1 Tax=Peptoniphilus sp. KCTC 25270 TaxID=2897414 RepID=UPI001E4C675B|nr:MATE family efflux transporter [Peptoniphilus sp. KCTC 25270]MCD1146624.1 MATE family efflux transporter [Peptoniphilus sp. KCTC 25270]